MLSIIESLAEFFNVREIHSYSSANLLILILMKNNSITRILISLCMVKRTLRPPRKHGI